MNSNNNEPIQTELKGQILGSSENFYSFSNPKKRSRENVENELPSVGTRRSKLGSADDYYENEMMKNISVLSSTKNYNSTMYSYTSKNDVMNLIWKLSIPKAEIVNVGNMEKVFSEKFMSKRKDIWNFDIELNNRGFDFIVKCENLDSGNSNNFNNNSSLIEKVFGSIFFDLDLSFQIINYRNQNLNFKNVKYNSEEIKKEIPLASDFFNLSYTQPNSSTRSNNKEKSAEEKDNVIIIAEISIHKNFEYRIHQGEGYIGIINEAATCYMNSMLQTLNIFGEFKKAVFQLPTADEDYNSVSLSLQRLFYDLMKDEIPVSTNRLVKSFGWGKEQISVQHDVQEFNLLLSDVMEKKMKGTPSEGTFSKLFEGRLINYIQCVNVDYKSEKEEKFNDLQLTVKGCKNIYESLNIYTEEEILDNADKYEADGYGKQKARKGIRFSKFPSVLILQLKRFEYNPKREAMVKINDYFEFYEEINLTNYMNTSLINENSDQNENNNLYTLHSVVVHQGNANSGHYFAFIRPTLKDLWMQFNDEIVRPADKYEVFNNNFGGNYTTYKHKSRGEVNPISNYYESNAYILVYIKNTERDRILVPVLPTHIPPYLISRFEFEKNEERKIQMKKLRMVENLNVILFTRESLLSDNNKNKLGLVNSFADLNYDSPLIVNKKQRMLINFPKYSSISDFLNFIQKETNIPMHLIKIYEYENGDASSEGIIKNRGNYDLTLIEEKEYNKTLHDFTYSLKKRIIAFFLYVEEDKLKIFHEDKFNFKEEWKLEVDNLSSDDDNQKIVFISKDLNSLKFYKNDENDTPKDDENFNSIDNSMTKLIFFKEYDTKANCFRITKTFSINLNTLNKFSQFEKFLRETYKTDNEKDISYLIERTCLPEKFLNSNNHVFLSSNNFYSMLNQVTSLILIPMKKREEAILKEKLEELYYTVYVDTYSIANSEYVVKKMKINYQNIQEEDQIKSLILENLNERELFKEVVDLQDHYYIDQNRNLVKIDEEFLKKSITKDFFELQIERDKGPKFWQACKEIPLLRYLNPNECRIEFNLHLFSKQILAESSFLHLSLFDINNNRICNLSVIYPKKIKKCRELIDFLYDIILCNKNFVSEIHHIDDYFFILQNPKKSYIYQMLIDNSAELSRYECKADHMEFRLQPFAMNDIEAFQNSNCYKIFVTFQSVGNKSKEKQNLKLEPIVVYADKNTKLFEVKFMLMEKMRKMGFSHEIETESIVKFYMAKVYDNKIHKETNLQQFKEDDSLENIFKDTRIYNILVEIVKSINK